MTKFLCLFLLALPLVGCDDMVDFFNDQPPCVDTCLKKPRFQTCQMCSCKPGQENIENHVCCQSGPCLKPPNATDPRCMNPQDGNVYLAIAQPTPVPDQPICGDKVDITWYYFNTSVGTLKSSAALNILEPFLNLHEQGRPESLDTIWDHRGWPELPSCGQTGWTVTTAELVPETFTPANFVAQVRQLPANTIGTDYFGFTVNNPPNNPKCPQ
ncbi:MAG TPA: hypothetical protein VNN72_22475 [Polyangiaceae bacterium]|nr:hypothetical protein [Polyangiaceae bacterium]